MLIQQNYFKEQYLYLLLILPISPLLIELRPPTFEHLIVLSFFQTWTIDQAVEF